MFILNRLDFAGESVIFTNQGESKANRLYRFAIILANLPTPSLRVLAERQSEAIYFDCLFGLPRFHA